MFLEFVFLRVDYYYISVGMMTTGLKSFKTITFTEERKGPPFETSDDDPLVLKTEVYIEDVNSFNALNMDFRVDYFLYHEWEVRGPTCEAYREHDEQLAADKMNYSGQVLVNSLNHTYFWIPDSFLANAKMIESTSKTQELRKLKITKVNNTCSMVFSTRRYAIVACQMAFDKHPFDTQSCPMTFRSYAYNMTLVTYEWKDSTKNPLNPELRLLRHSLLAYKKIGNLSVLGETYSSAYVLFLFERHMAHYIMQVFAPSAFIVVISWFSFWLGYENTSVTDRITLSITGLLTLVTQFAGFRSELPPASYITGIDIWMSVCLIFIFLVILETVIGSFLNRQWKDNAPRMIPFPPTYPEQNNVYMEPMTRKPCNKQHTPNVFQVTSPPKSERRHAPGAAVLIMYPKSTGPIQQLTYFLGQTILDSSRGQPAYLGVTPNPADKLDKLCRFVVPAIFLSFIIGFFVHYVMFYFA